MRIRPGVELASLTDVGCVRENNEDSYIYWEPEGDELSTGLGRLAIVADGMGGYRGGEIASQLAVETVKDVYAHSGESDVQECLLSAFSEAHRRIRERARANPELSEMGTTCTALVLTDGQAHFAHVGDSRLYFLSERKLRLLTRDHTLMARWIENGVISSEEAETHPQRHVLTAALGVAEGIQPDSSPEAIQVQPGDVLMLCTDGLWGQVKEDEIQRTISTCSPADACRILCDLAKQRGGPDNITLQILRIT
ncbi:MAG TPA: Stp1/IreP family PP2C-type Ser/Thr phosphatase [Terriglobales bacterium]|nr:Stp1/IreP family PP2C-type Ser/Thr phosphatase [Terriglobales bacterium]